MFSERGLRNNNPMNMIKGIEWQGLALPSEMTPRQRAEGKFAVFVAPEWGIRAGVRNLHTYREKYGLVTVRGIISRWAPEEDDNDVEAYVQAVSEGMSVDPDQKLDTTDPVTLAGLVRGIIQHENGKQPYTAALIDRAIEMAGGPTAVVPAPGGGGALGRNKSKIQSAFRSFAIGSGALLVGLGWAEQPEIDELGGALELVTSQEFLGAVAAAIATLWGIFDRAKKIGFGDL